MRLAALLALSLATGCVDRAKPAVALYDKGDYAGAARASEASLAEHPGDDGLWAMRVRSALALGDAAGVEKAYAAYREHRGGDDRELLRDVAFATLDQALQSPSGKARIIALKTIERDELQDYLDDVGKQLGAEDDRVAATAAAAVLRGLPDAVRAAGQLEHSENAEARRIIIDGLGRKLGKVAASSLEAAASDPDARVRSTALRYLGVIKDANAVEICVKRMRDPDPDVRAAAALALGRIGVGNLAAYGKQALADHALGERLAGVELLRLAGATGELTSLTDGPDPIVAAEAAFAVKRNDLAAKAIERAAQSPAWTVRAGAANMVDRALDKPAARALEQRLAGDAELGVRIVAARALTRLDDRAAALEIFAAALGDAQHGIEAAAALAEYGHSVGDERGFDALSADLVDQRRSPEDRALAASLHERLARATPGLVAALADLNPVVRATAASSILAIARE